MQRCGSKRFLPRHNFYPSLVNFLILPSIIKGDVKHEDDPEESPSSTNTSQSETVHSGHKVFHCVWIHLFTSKGDLIIRTHTRFKGFGAPAVFFNSTLKQIFPPFHTSTPLRVSLP